METNSILAKKLETAQKWIKDYNTDNRVSILTLTLFEVGHITITLYFYSGKGQHALVSFSEIETAKCNPIINVMKDLTS